MIRTLSATAAMSVGAGLAIASVLLGLWRSSSKSLPRRGLAQPFKTARVLDPYGQRIGSSQVFALTRGWVPRSLSKIALAATTALAVASSSKRDQARKFRRVKTGFQSAFADSGVRRSGLLANRHTPGVLPRIRMLAK